MKIKGIKLAVIVSVSVIAGFWLWILLTDTKVLVSETRIEPGQSYTVSGYGDLGKLGQASLVGKYFNGRQIITRVFWYSPNNIMGKDACPFLLKEDQ